MGTILITGINGFVGEHAAREFKEQGHIVRGVGHDNTPNEKVRDLLDEYIQCDLVDEAQIRQKISLKDTEAVLHLAGLAAVGQSFEQPRRYLTDNSLMTFNILQQAAEDHIPGRVIVVSSGALYDPAQPLPLTEQSITTPTSPYAVSKLTTEEIARYFASRGVSTVIARPFNHIGPGQGPGFILPDFYAQLAHRGKTAVIRVGNIDTKRDYTDVRDIVRAYRLLALAPSLSHDTYNICSGKSLSGRTILDYLAEAMEIKDIQVEVDPARVRPTDIADIVGDFSRLHDELGWQPSIPIKQTIKDFVDKEKEARL